MPRERQIGITEKQWEQFDRLDARGRERLTDEQRRNLKTNIKRVITKELDDLRRFFSESTRMGTFWYPFEAVLPKSRYRYASELGDRAAMMAILDQIREWREALDLVETAVGEYSQRYIRP